MIKDKISIIWHLLPPPPLKKPFFILLAVFLGMALVLFRLSNAMSYLSDSPEACINCHIMTTEYSTWQHGSHGRETVCNDCHVPHDNFIRKYLFKASDGSRHAAIFTLNLQPQVIELNEAGKSVVQSNCLRCHIRQLETVAAADVNGQNYFHGEGKLCWNCHREVPHGRVHGLASTPYSIVPGLTPPVPSWMTNIFINK